MKKRVILYFAPSLSILLLLLLLPASAFAATSSMVASSASQHSIHPALSTAARQTSVNPFAGGNLSYHGGPVQAGTAHLFAIFWQPTNNVSSGYHSLIQRFFTDIGGSTLYRNNTQYTQTGGGAPTSATLSGTFTDTLAYPESPLLDIDLQHEVTRAQGINGWTSATNNIFFVFLQRGENLCFDSSHSQCASNTFCAYHDFFGSRTIYAAMPYAASFSCRASGQTEPNHDDADLTINVASHEEIEAATDPLLNAWFDSVGNEIGDKCNFNFGPTNAQGGDITINGHPYEVQKEWDNRVGGCVLSGP
ncbi:MAG TPA: hypothetical protein VGF67_00215 [Ktedonobacteraceae bacterium]